MEQYENKGRIQTVLWQKCLHAIDLHSRTTILCVTYTTCIKRGREEDVSAEKLAAITNNRVFHGHECKELCRYHHQN